MYLPPDFYTNNLEKGRTIIAPVIEEYKSGKITYAEAEFNALHRNAAGHFNYLILLC